MQFRIADTFTGSLTRLTGEEQKAAKTTAFDLQIDPVNPGMSFHKLDRAKDKNFWSVRVTRDIRLIVHKSKDSLLLCYVDHHDQAYAWAERRKLETHPATGAAQLVELRETFKEVVVPVYVEAQTPAHASPAMMKPAILAGHSDDDLLAFGVPQEWLADVKAATEDTLLSLADHLPAEAAEALLELATGGKPRLPQTTPSAANPFDHPDAQRRFRVVANVEELRRALDFPWDKWTIFLHPEQRQWVERDFAGPARVSGSAGTGKTIVALHRAAFLARTNPDARVLLTTFSDPLASALQTRLKRLLADQPRLGERIDVHSLDAIGMRLHRAHVGQVNLASEHLVREVLKEAAAAVPGQKFGLRFLADEWQHVVDAWQVKTWEAYRDVARLGRKTRLSEAKRRTLWAIFEQVRDVLETRGLTTHAAMFTSLASALSRGDRQVFDHVVVDEAQDLSVAHLRFFSALGGGRPDALFFAGDLGQRIFQQLFSWKGLGVDIRGRSRTLRVNYRTSHQIRARADRLLDPAMADVDGAVETRSDTVSVFNGPSPAIQTFENESAEVEAVAKWIGECLENGVHPHELAVFVRSADQHHRAQAAIHAAAVPGKLLDERVETASGTVSFGTMHLAKGLEFRAVAVMACDDEVIPLQSRIEAVGDDTDLKEVYDTERQLLYVACTRARDFLRVTGVQPASEFLDDLGAVSRPLGDRGLPPKPGLT